MDFIGQLSQQLGMQPTQAQGLAGSLLTMVQGAVKEKLGAPAAEQLGQAIPELGSWHQQAQAQAPHAVPQAGAGEGLMGALGGLGGLLGGHAQGGEAAGQAPSGGGLLGALGGAVTQAGELAGLVAVLQRFHLDAGKAALVAPLLLDFLKSRLDPQLLSGVLSALPMLAQFMGGSSSPEGGGSPGGGSLGGVLGGLFR